MRLELDEERAGCSQVGQEKVGQRDVATNVSYISRRTRSVTSGNLCV